MRARAWRLGEGSANVGGMPGLFVLKTFILGFAVVIALHKVDLVKTCPAASQPVTASG